MTQRILQIEYMDLNIYLLVFYTCGILKITQKKKEEEEKTDCGVEDLNTNSQIIIKAQECAMPIK